MNETLIFDPLLNTLDPQTCTIVHGREILRDPGLALLRRYLPVLAVIAAPYAGVGGDGDPLQPLDPVREWRALLRLLGATHDLQSDISTRLAMVRLMPPTVDDLRAVLKGLGPDHPDAFRVVHIVAHGEPDSLYLEDVHGGEMIVRDAQLVNLFQGSAAQIVLLEGCFNHLLAHQLIAETPIQAVIGTRRRIPEDDMVIFGAHFYRQLTAGSSVRIAYQTALNHLSDQAVDQVELVVTESLHQVTLDMPEAALRAERSLIAPGMPRMIGVPQPVGFVGRRDDLTALAHMLPDVQADETPGDTPGMTVCALQGPTGFGKTWLAAAFATRFSWRFPGGVLWFRCGAITALREVVAAAARLIGLSAYTSAADVLALLRDQRVLLVIEDVDRIAIPAERERLIQWLRRVGLGPDGASAVLMTGCDLEPALVRDPAVFVQPVRAYSYKDARTLAMQVAIARGLDVLDVDTIDDFLDFTLYIPWLIMRGIDLIEATGMDATLGTFAGLTSEARDPVSDYVQRRVHRLAIDQSRALTLVIRAQGLPGAFDAALAGDLVGDEALAHIATLLNHGVLWIADDAGNGVGSVTDGDSARDPAHTRYRVPPPVRDYIAEREPLARTQQDFLDRAALAYLARTWPEGVEPEPFGTIDHVLRARLDMVRTLIQRQLRPDIQLDLNVMAHVLGITGPTFCAAGLAREFVGYATGFREQISGGIMLARLQIAMAEALAEIPASGDEAAQLFRVTIAIPDLDPVTRAHASRSYGRFLIAANQPVVAERMLQRIVDGLLAQRDPRTRHVTARLALDLANVLALQGHHHEAAGYYEMAQRGFAAERDAIGSAEAQRDHSQMLIATGDPARAEDMLRRALTAAEVAGRRDLAADMRGRLADLHAGRANSARRENLLREEHAELRLAEDYLNDAITDGLHCGESPALAGWYLALGRAIARLDRLDEALAHIERGRALLARLGQWQALASALVMVGQLQMARGNSIAALDSLHEALDLAAELKVPDALQQAANVLVRVHRIRARHISRADQHFAEDSLQRAHDTLARLHDLGLADSVAALEDVITGLEGL